MIYTFTPDFLYWRQTVDHQKIKDELYPKIMETVDILPTPWDSCNAKSSIEMSHLNDPLFTNEITKKVLWEPFEDFITEFSSSFTLKLGLPKTSKLDHWYNVYYEGDTQEVHNHIAPSFTYGGNIFHAMYSVIYILHQTGPSKTVFRKTSHSPGTFTGDANTYDTSKVASIKEGSVLIFPTHLDHYVLPAEGNRVTLSFNIHSTFA